MSQKKDDLISRRQALELKVSCGYEHDGVLTIPYREVKTYLEGLPPAQPEPLTDTEQRIFLAAMAMEEKVCKQIDEECRDPYEDSLVKICHEITRKVKGVLWI